MLKPGKPKHVFEQGDLSLVSTVKHAVDVAGDADGIGTAVTRHAALDREKVGPEVVDGLDRGAGGMVRPKGAGREPVRPRGQRAAIATADENPRLFEPSITHFFVDIRGLTRTAS